MCYEQWRQPAVDEILLAGDLVPEEIPERLKKTAGGKVAFRWEDPRRAMKITRTAEPNWAQAAAWLDRFLGNITKLLASLEAKLATGIQPQGEEEVKVNKQLKALREHLKGIENMKRSNTPFPKDDPQRQAQHPLRESPDHLRRGARTLGPMRLGAGNQPVAMDQSTEAGGTGAYLKKKKRRKRERT